MCFITVPLRSNLIKKRLCEHSGTPFAHVRSFTTRSEHEHGILGYFRVLLTGNAHAVSQGSGEASPKIWSCYANFKSA